MAHGKVRALLKRPWVWVLLVAVALYYVLEYRGYRSIFYTPGDRFRAVMAKRAAECAKHGPQPDTAKLRIDLEALRAWQAQEERCALLKVQVEDWRATPEGRFAHAIKIPNPVPEDSGYRWWMRPIDYFRHLCEKEAGEFIFKTVDRVEGTMQLRPRETGIEDASSMGSKYRHLYAMEDPYGHRHGETEEPGFRFLEPNKYSFFELPAGSIQLPEWKRRTADPSQFDKPKPGDTIERYYGYDARSLTSLKKEFDTQRKARYGFTWRGIKRPHDREMAIAGGELIVLDLETNEVLGVRRGYALHVGQWQATPVCPKYGYEGSDKGFDFTYWFVGKVLRPPRWKESFDALEKTK